MSDRDEKGRFIPGHSIKSPGRPNRATEAEYLDAIKDGLPLEQITKAAVKMGKLAAAGDVQAFRAILPYTAGLPVQKLQLSNGDAAILAELLDAIKARGLSPSEMFNAMLFELNQEAASDEQP